MRKILKKLMPSKATKSLEESTRLLREAAEKLDQQTPETKARTGRIFLEASGPHVNPRARTSTA